MRKKTTSSNVPVKQESLLDDPELGVTEAALDLDSLTMKGKRWSGKFRIKATLPQTFFRYRIVCELDEEPHLRRIEEIEKSLDDTLLRDDRAMRRNTSDKVKEIRKKLEELRKETETIEFGAQVEALKYDGPYTILTLMIPDDIIEPFNRQKTRLELYKVRLSPMP